MSFRNPENLIEELHGRGYGLEEFDFNERTGETISTYERAVYSDEELADPDFEPDTIMITGFQPAGRNHLGWRWHDGRYTTGYDSEGNAIVE